ncbi:hypothetical protein [Alteromonas sp. V450]|nr:hypothetical protein [Alteromonas sp. V450]
MAGRNELIVFGLVSVVVGTIVEKNVTAATFFTLYAVKATKLLFDNH